LSTKKRVYDIAKEYGMTGQDLAKHLRDRGMTQIKGHMAALDDFLVLQIEGMLEAEGRTRVQVRARYPASLSCRYRRRSPVRVLWCPLIHSLG